MAQVDLGKIAITYGGQYDPNASYEKLTVVENSIGVKYISIIDADKKPLNDSNYWKPISGDFVEQYQGPKSSDPTTRNDGSPLQAGDLYFNTVQKKLMAYDGSNWVSATKFDFPNLTDDGTDLKYKGFKVWNQDNDGDGSGLDADLLDGRDGEGYRKIVKLPNNHDTTDYVKIGYVNGIDNNVGAELSFTIENATDFGRTKRNRIFVTLVERYLAGFFGSNRYAHLTTYKLGEQEDSVGVEIGLVKISDHEYEVWIKRNPYNPLVIVGSSSSFNGTLYDNPVITTTEPSGITFSGPTNGMQFFHYDVWTSENHGAGSGLDADLLDGNDGSYYLGAELAFRTTNTTSNTFMWTKICDVEIDGQYKGCSFTLAIVHGGSADADNKAGILQFRVKQQDVFGNDPEVFLEQTVSEKFVSFGYVIDQNTNPSKVSLYMLINNGYTTFYGYKLAHYENCKVTWRSDQALLSDIPNGLRYGMIRPQLKSGYIDNINDITYPGFYYVPSYGTGAPGTSDFGVIVGGNANSLNSDEHYQLAISKTDTGDIYTRRTLDTSGNFTNWKHINSKTVGGEGYHWVDETANRAKNTTYTNIYGKPIMVSVRETSNGDFYILVDGIAIGRNIGDGRDSTLVAIVPSGSTYKVTGSANINAWYELK